MKDFFRFLFSWKFLIHLGLAVLVVIGIFFLWTWMLGWYTNHGMSITVPDFRGKTVDESLRTLEEKNLKYLVRDTVFFDNKRKGSILEQDPLPESHVKEGRVIYFTINGSTPPNIKFPDGLEGSLRNWTTQLESKGFQVNANYIPGPDKDYVVRAVYRGKEVQPGQLIPKGSTIDLDVESGYKNDPVRIPYLVGLTVQEALQKIKENNLTLGSVRPPGLENDPKAYVDKQIPVYDSSATMNQGDPVYLYLKLRNE
jgi:beta-lactam-binding protein with PASTA domain